MRKVPDFIKGFLEYSSNHESSDTLRTWVAISCLAGTLHRKVWIDFDLYKLFPNMYIFIVGQSGLVKKSTSMNIGVDLLREVGVKIMSDRVTPASLVREIKDAASFTQFDGATHKHSSVFSYASELKSTFGGSINSVSELLTDLYDCNPNDANKPWIHKSGAGTTKVYGPCLNILAGTTPIWLKKMIPSSDMEGGFASRVIFVVEKPSGRFVAWPELDDSQKELRKDLIETLKHINSRCVGRFRVHSEARELFTAWYENHMKYDLPKVSDPKFSGYMGRKGDIMRKLAMIRSASLGDDLIIEREHLLWAGEQLESIEKGMFDAMKSYSEEDLMHDIAEYLRSRGSAPLTEIVKVFSNKASDRAIADYCLDLRVSGVLSSRDSSQGLLYSYREEGVSLSGQGNMDTANDSETVPPETSDTQSPVSGPVSHTDSISAQGLCPADPLYIETTPCIDLENQSLASEGESHSLPQQDQIFGSPPDQSQTT